MTIRAEDGRYVDNCNISAFLSNLPIPPGSGGGGSRDCQHFSSEEASGSTSQAANVMEALELQASSFLIDEDVSAANFMARDGRMRALVMDESITPLLYRVNGLFRTHGVSSIVVVGGVGDWLDVADNVILMKNYTCHDATAKARSISKQFSHGHVQYAGRGVVHRLDWDPKKYTPLPRRPTTETARLFVRNSTTIDFVDGGNGMNLVFDTTVPDQNDTTTLDDDSECGNDRFLIDMSRCEQLLGRKPQLYGCGLAVLWVLEQSCQQPHLSLNALLDRLDQAMDQDGLDPILALSPKPPTTTRWHGQQFLTQMSGFVYRPRRFEVGQAICRLRGIRFHEVPENSSTGSEDGTETMSNVDLMELWKNRRKK